ncbi:hypothetical protein ACQ4PT_055965 [Festuca glaucescens]
MAIAAEGAEARGGAGARREEAEKLEEDHGIAQRGPSTETVGLGIELPGGSASAMPLVLSSRSPRWDSGGGGGGWDRAATKAERKKAVFWPRPRPSNGNADRGIGFLYLRSEVRRLVLLLAQGKVIDGRDLGDREAIGPGMEVDLPGFRVHVGYRHGLPPASKLPQPSGLSSAETKDKVTSSRFNSSPEHRGRFTSSVLSTSANPSYCSTAPSASPAELLAAMANFPVDPTPYIPGQYELIQVANRPQQCRYHVTDGIRAKHEDVAIATITPPPGDAIPFGLVRNMLRNLIEIQFGFNLEMIQRCPIGTAYIRVSSFADRDWLVSRSPHQFAGRTISFVNHNEGINHRAFTYNQECLLLLVAYPMDLWSTEHIKRAVKDFGVFVAWDEEASSYGAIVVKVRVPDLQHIPHSCVVTDGNSFQGESWAVPIFILSQKLLGNLPADEDDPPADGSTPHPMPVQPFQPDFVPGVHDDVHEPAHVWPAWEPNHQPFDAVHEENVQHNVNIQQNMEFLFPGNGALNLNVPPPDNALDLNVLPDDGFIELNDLVNPIIQNQ